MESRHTMSMEEMLSALRRLLRRETVPLEGVEALLEARGVADERDTRARGQAIAAMMRYILQDSEVKALLENVLQVRRLGYINRVFEEDRDYRFAQILGEGFWKEFSAKKRQIDEAIVHQFDGVRPKLIVLEFLAGKMEALGYTEEFELPELEPPFPPLPPAQRREP